MRVGAPGETGQAATGDRQVPVIEVIWRGAVATATATGELDRSGAAQLACEVRRVAACAPQKLVLDLHGAILVNLPSARLMATMRKVVAGRCLLVLCNSPHLAGPHAGTGMLWQLPANRSGPDGAFSVQLAWTKDQATLTLTGELDLVTGHHVQDALRKIMLRPGRAVHLDLSGLMFADVAGTRALWLAMRELQAMGRQVTATECGRRAAEWLTSSVWLPQLDAPLPSPSMAGFKHTAPGRSGRRHHS